MKICDVTQFYSEVGGGVKRYLQEKRRYIERETQDEHVLVIPGEKTAVVREGRLTTCTVASPKIDRTSRYRLLFNLKGAEEMIEREKPDIIESGDPYHLGWRAIDIGDRLEIPVLGFYHSHFPEAYLRTVLKYCGPWLRDAGLAYAQDYIYRLYNRFDLSLVPSQFLVDLLASWGVTNAKRVRLGVDTSIFNSEVDAGDVRKRLNIPNDRFLLLYIGRLAGEKNSRTLMEAFRLLYKRHPKKFSFLVIGDGGLRSVVAEARNDTESMRWIPYCNDADELARCYRAADLFVHPGVCETFGLVTMESQACACPVVGIRGSYMDANIFAGLEHWAPSNTPAALAGAIESYLDLDCRAMGQKASQVVLKDYTWSRVLGEMRSLYELAIENKKREIRGGGMW